MKYLTIIALIILIVACSGDKIKFEKDQSGLEYKIIKNDKSNGIKTKLGDVLILDMRYEKEDGTVLFESAKSDRKYLRKLEKPSHKGGSFEDGLLLLSEGDSAIFKINAEAFLRYSESYSNLPKGIKPEDNILVFVKIIEILEKNEYEDLLLERYHKDKDTEMQILEKYLSNANITTEPSESGLYYIEQVKGTGKKAEKGNLVSVHYTVKYIDGKVIETSLGKNPFTFTLGTGAVIKAWDEGIAYMNQGGKALIIAPSHLAYGDQGNQTILPYSSLVFEVELISVN